MDGTVIERQDDETAAASPGLVKVISEADHCSKSFLRSSLWSPTTWQPEAVPSRARFAETLERPDEALDDLECYYGPAYAERLYG